ncbi:MAG: metallophosphoesterase [Chloroflexota bacterium]
MDAEPPIYVVGDIHGQMGKLKTLLIAHDLTNEDLGWTGGASVIWFIGDYLDRGEAGVEIIDVISQLHQQADRAGGGVRALLGNHDVTLLAAVKFGDAKSSGPGGTFRADWERNGGNPAFMDAVSDRHVGWLSTLPVMQLFHDRLFVHADSTFYEQYGFSIDEVNEGFRILLRSDDTKAWDTLLHRFSEREAFHDAAAEGTARARTFLERYGGKQIIHGHTPIDKMTGQKPENVRDALVYADRLCVNVDGGMYRGGPGFLYPMVAREPVLL